MSGALRALWAALAALATAAPVAAAPPAARPAPAASAIFPYGVSWYPEQFPEGEWAGDLAQMRRAHITFVRMAEFSWAKLEPREGVYDFGWLDRAVALAAANGIRVVIGTPTAAPPVTAGAARASPGDPLDQMCAGGVTGVKSR